jgi:hypothetical protein
MEFKLDWAQIQLKGNEIQIDTKDIKNMLVTMKFEFFFEKTNIQKTCFHSSLLGNSRNIY